MFTYTTLGSGKATKVLAVGDYGPARTVTTAPAESATQLARALQSTHRQMAAALYRVAVDANATPVAARRQLLTQFDRMLEDPTVTGRTDLWEAADGLLARLTTALAGTSESVRSAVRTELGDQLTGYDGVLVPARASTQGYKRSWLDVCVSGALADMGENWWTYAFGEHTDFELVADDDVFPTGGPCVASSELDSLVHALYEAEPCGTAWADGFDMEDLSRTADASETCVVFGIRRDHLEAYVAHHKPFGVTALPELRE